MAQSLGGYEETQPVIFREGERWQACVTIDARGYVAKDLLVVMFAR